jgi:hypothetical protein
MCGCGKTYNDCGEKHNVSAKTCVVVKQILIYDEDFAIPLVFGFWFWLPLCLLLVIVLWGCWCGGGWGVGRVRRGAWQEVEVRF